MVNGRLHTLRSWLWPGECLLCRARTDAGEDLCPGCRKQLPWITALCPRCAISLPEESASVPCGNCQRKAPVFDRAYAALHYAAPVDRLILNLKYHHRLELARALGRLLAGRLLALPDRLDIIVPVPLHPSRLRERGYNQSLEIARILATQLQVPLAANVARRVRATASQTTLPMKQRARNVRNAFNVKHDLSGKRVAIVDDVMTTGHTVSALAKALRRAGAEEISVWVVARA